MSGTPSSLGSVERIAHTDDIEREAPQRPPASHRQRNAIALIALGVLAAALGGVWFAAASTSHAEEGDRLAESAQLEAHLDGLRADTQTLLDGAATLDAQTAALETGVGEAAAAASLLDAAIVEREAQVRAIQAEVWGLYESMTDVVSAESAIAASIDAAVTNGNERRVDALARTATRVQSELLPELAAAVEAVEGAARKLALAVAANGAAFDIAEDFEPPMDGWRAGFSTNGLAEPVDGTYAITAVDDGYLMWGLSPYTLADATISVTATAMEGPDDGLFSYGVVCRSAQSDFLAGYWFAVDSTGTYQVGQFVPPGDFVDLVAGGRQVYRSDPAALRDVVNTGLASNRLEVVCDGSALSFGINGETVWEGSDDTLTAGAVALAAISYENAPVTVRFDDLRLVGGAGGGGGAP